MAHLEHREGCWAPHLLHSTHLVLVLHSIPWMHGLHRHLDSRFETCCCRGACLLLVCCPTTFELAAQSTKPKAIRSLV